MTWFKVDDQLASHPKPRRAGLAAMGLWAVAGAWSSGYLEDGFVPTWYVDSWPQGRRYASRLVAASLWFEVDGGWRFHDWEDWQPTREQKLAERETTRKRVEKWRADLRSKQEAEELAERGNAVGNGVTQDVGNGVTGGVTNGVGNGVRTPAPTRPDPTRPVVTKVTTEKTRRFAPPDLDNDPDFVAFWDVYPRRTSKGAAKKAWLAALRKKVDATAVVGAAKSFAITCQGKDLEFIPHPSTWLNGERWADEQATPHTGDDNDWMRRPRTTA